MIQLPRLLTRLPAHTHTHTHTCATIRSAVKPHFRTRYMFVCVCVFWPGVGVSRSARRQGDSRSTPETHPHQYAQGPTQPARPVTSSAMHTGERSLCRQSCRALWTMHASMYTDSIVRAHNKPCFMRYRDVSLHTIRICPVCVYFCTCVCVCVCVCVVPVQRV